jgi:tagatose 1,6-diphosphate aldolase GatY/KbaY
MPLVTSKKMLLAAREGHWAVGAFNAENMEMIQAIIQAAETLNAPVIIQTTPGTLKYGSLELFFAAAYALAKSSSIAVALHLDHGDSFALAAKALRAGYTSIMIDGSKFPLEENIAFTEAVVKFCAPNHIPVEGELGKVGGKEDDTKSEETGYTDPDEAVIFVEKTGVSSLAIGVGTAHGVYAKTPVLNVELISTIKKFIQVPLVLHGASGLSDDVVRDCISRGICKVNFATELRIAYTDAVRASLGGDSKIIDPKKFGTPAREAVKDAVSERIKVCGCDNKAALIQCHL